MTSKALSSFVQVEDLTLVEFHQSNRRLGVIVKSKAQAEVVVEHIKKTMSKETPRLLCYEPKEPRTIEVNDK